MPLPWTPGEGLHCCFMFRETVPGLADYLAASHPRVNVPNAEQVVIATACQLLSVWTPLESTDLLSVVLEGTHEATRSSYVVVIYICVE